MKEKTLNQLYWGDMMSQREIAETHGVSQRTIGRWMKEEGVATRVRIEACRTERSRKKSSDLIKGEKHPQFGKKGEEASNWRGGRITNRQGYVYLYSPDHPNTNCQGYVLEHRLVMEKELGRYLTPIEVVHHDKGKTDNLPEDLRLFKNSGDHQRYELSLKRLNKMSADLG